MSNLKEKLVYARLMELANGAEPESPVCGICNDINEMVFDKIASSQTGYEYLGDLFRRMGYDGMRPLGEEDVAKGRYELPWEGSRGEARRKLCRETAEFIKEYWL